MSTSSISSSTSSHELQPVRQRRLADVAGQRQRAAGDGARLRVWTPTRSSTALMASDQQQVTNLTEPASGLTAMNTQLTNIMTALQTVANDAQALGNPSLFTPTQTVNSTNSTLVGATAHSSVGAVVGSYQVTSRRWRAPRRRRSRSPARARATTFTIDGQQRRSPQTRRPRIWSTRSTPTARDRLGDGRSPSPGSASVTGPAPIATPGSPIRATTSTSRRHGALSRTGR